jgi:hypothetical protein
MWKVPTLLILTLETLTLKVFARTPLSRARTQPLELTHACLSDVLYNKDHHLNISDVLQLDIFYLGREILETKPMVGRPH